MWCALASLAVAAGCKGEVVGGLDERQAQEALAALSRGGVAALREPMEGTGKEPRYAIVAPASEVGRAAELLRAEGLPRQPDRGFGELYGTPSMIPSPTEERARYVEALSGEIATQLEHLSAVVDASVLVNVPAQDPLAPLDAPRPRATASVLLTVRAGETPPAPDDVRRLVAGAAGDLAAADVAVVVQSAPPPPAQAGAAYESVGGILVARGSKGALVGVLAAGLAALLALGGWVAMSGARRRRA